MLGADVVDQVARLANEADVRGLMQLADVAPVMTLATRAPGPSVDPSPYATPVFYVMVCIRDCVLLAFASDRSSTHGLHIGTGPTRVAAAAYAPAVAPISAIRGFQALGDAHRLAPFASDIGVAVRQAYFARFPAAEDVFARSSASFFVMWVDWAKITDNARLGIGRHESLTFPQRQPSDLDALQSLVGAHAKN